MDIRNIQRTGGKSFSITLPKEWIAKNSLADKDKLRVLDKHRYLIVAPFHYATARRMPHCTIEGMTKKQMLRHIIGSYLSGAEEIIIRAQTISFEQRAAVRQISYTLIGCECMESTSNQMVLRCTSNNVAQLIPEYLGKMLGIITAMYHDTLYYLRTNDKDMARDIIERDTEIDRLHLSILRSHNIRLNAIEDESADFSLYKSHYHQLIATHLERIGDHIVRIANYFLLINPKEATEFNAYEKKRMKLVMNNLTLFDQIIKKFDPVKSNEYLDSFEVFTSLNLNLKHKNRNILNLVVAESISRIHSYLANIAEETINYLHVEEIYPEG